MLAASDGSGIKLVRIASRPGVGLESGAQSRSSEKCGKRNAAVSLDKGHASRLQVAMMEQLGKLDDRLCRETGQPGRGYLSLVQREQ